MKREFSNLVKQISSLRFENVKLRECFEAELSQVESDDRKVLNSFKTRVEVLETLVKSYESELSERSKAHNFNNSLRFLENLVEEKK